MRAFITGVTGQDGHYLSELLLEKGYSVYGLVRRSSQARTIPKGVQVVEGDVTDPSMRYLITEIAPHEIYNLAAMSHVGESFRIPRTTFDVNAIGTLHALEAAADIGCKFYQASTSELFGSSPPPQNELTTFAPRSPYAIAKLASYWMTVNYRERGLYACNGILFNHESPLRGNDFVTQKIARYVALLHLYRDHFQPLKLGNLDAIRDWGHAKDFVYGMWLMMQEKTPDDYVLATGEPHSVRDFLTEAFKAIGIDDWSPYVQVDPSLLRPTDVEHLCGDPTKARRLGWEPTYTFQALVEEMIDGAIDKLSVS